ncbi:MAG TPA: aminoacetone oxidase family FAD-binding enzyme [Candidatus Paceibacterota bacterium]|nr:aminoacetone oxidase family FAD-binding enzyme [Candidatus Paceibacterota bacterium]
MSNEYDVIVIGGGASGMMAAGRAGELGKRVLLLEKNKKLGEKLSITGGGRCNILNAEEDEQVLLKHFGKAEQFLYSPFSQFGMKESYQFFERRGLPLIVEARKRAFPKSEKAGDVVKTLETYLRAGNVEVRLNAPVERVLIENNVIAGVVVGGATLTADAYILATGGVSHPETGSTGDGFAWLSALGHRVQQPSPTIVPLAASDPWIKQLSGISIPNMKITFFADGTRAFSERGTLLLTHFGLSGPLILNAASKVADLLAFGSVTAVIDTYPDMDLGVLERHMTTVFDANKNKALKNVFRTIAPVGTSAVMLSLAEGVDPEIKVHSVTKLQRRMLAHTLKSLPVTIIGLMGFDRAVVADGGVDLTEIDTKTFRSRLVSNLFITGDLLHIRRPSGGYSLQLAWTSGFVAGDHASRAR